MPPGSADLAPTAWALGPWALVAGALGLLAVALFAAWRRGAPGGSRLLLSLPAALGDAALLLGPEGRVIARNAVARRLLGPVAARGQRTGKDALLGAQLEALRRGLERGPGAAGLLLPGGLRGQGILVRLSRRPLRELLLIRLASAPRPPPLPATPPPPVVPAVVPALRSAAHADLAAVGASLRVPAARAATSAALLRLSLPALPPTVEAELRTLERALAELERRLGALRAAATPWPGPPRTVDLAAVVRDLAAGAEAALVRLQPVDVPSARVRVDEPRLRAALREVLRAALGEMAGGGELRVRAGVAGPEAVVELTWPVATGADAEAVALARALLGPEGGRVEVEAVPGRGRTCRILLPAALEPAEGIMARGGL